MATKATITRTIVLTIVLLTTIISLHQQFSTSNLYGNSYLSLSLSSDLVYSSNVVPEDKEKYFLVFVIPSHPSKIENRKAARATWTDVANWALLNEVEEEYKRIKVMFIFGSLKSGSYSTEFEEELSQNSDMYVVDSIPEGRDSLRYKVQWGINHSHHSFHFEYLVKTDDDITVNVPLLIESLRALPPGLHYTGLCALSVGRPPQRWTWCSGGGYVLSRDLVTEIVKLPAKVHEPLMRPEDTFTGWLVWNVNNNTQYSVRPVSIRSSLKLGLYKCGPLKAWFYHGYTRKNLDVRLETFRTVLANNSEKLCDK